MGESTAVLLFVCAVATVYLFAALAVVRVVRRRFTRPEVTVIELVPESVRVN